MQKNIYLESAAKMLKKQGMYCKFHDQNLLEVSLDKDNKVFAYLVIEKEQFPGIVLSLALDFHETYIVADLTINLMHIAPVALGEAFYRSNSGELYWGEAAVHYFALEYDDTLLKALDPITKSFH